MYAPRIQSADPLYKLEIDGRPAVVLGNIESGGHVQYLYIMVVYDHENKPCLFATSEVNIMAQELGGDSHFLCLFQGDSHYNQGASDDYADLDKFMAQAIKVARVALAETSNG